MSLSKNVTPSKKKVSIRSKLDDLGNFAKKTSHDLRLDKSKRAFTNISSVDKNEEKGKRLRVREPFVMHEKNFRFEFALIKETRLCAG